MFCSLVLCRVWQSQPSQAIGAALSGRAGSRRKRRSGCSLFHFHFSSMGTCLGRAHPGGLRIRNLLGWDERGCPCSAGSLH